MFIILKQNAFLYNNTLSISNFSLRKVKVVVNDTIRESIASIESRNKHN